MSRKEPLRRVDLALLSLYGLFVACVGIWFVVALIGFLRPDKNFPWFDTLLAYGPPILVGIQGLFFLIASQASPFRQRIMASDASSRDALIGAAVLWAGALLFIPLWMG